MNKISITEIKVNEKDKEKEYSEFLDNCPGSVVQQTIEWRDVIKDISPDNPSFLTLKNNNTTIAVLPCYIFKSSLGNIITSIPHAGPLGGIVCSPTYTEKEKIYKLLLEEMIKIGKENNCILATIITSPFNKDVEIYKNSFSFDYFLEKFTQYIKLSKTLNFSHGIRNNINNGLRAGIIIRELKNIKELKDWYKIHEKRMRELNAKSLPFEIFYNSYRILIPKKKAIFFIAECQKRIIGGCLYIFHNDIIDVYMLSSDSEFKKLSPSTFLINYSIHWAKTNGFKYYNFQSSKKRGDGVYKFKEQWGSEDHPYFFLTKIIGDCSKLLSQPLEKIAKEYKWHYALPYDLWEKGKQK